MPLGATSGPVVVWTAAQPSNGVGVTVVMGPEIHRLGPTWGPAGTPVVISGVNFGATQGSSTVTFNGVAAATTAWSDSSVTATVPGGTTSGLVVVTRGTASPGVPFTVGTEEVVYYTTDGIGSVRMITTFNQHVVSRHDYLPFGEEWQPTPSHPQPLGFAGKELDPETGTSSSQALNYFGARYLHSATGRFTAVDPVFTIKENIFDPQRWNRYVYVRNNPQRYVDPDGRAIETGWDAFNVGLGLGSLAWNLWRGNFRDAAIDAGGVIFDAGATAIPGLPGGVATAIRSSRAVRAGQELLTQATRLSDHHLLPQQFRKFFADRDIDIDLFTITVDHDVTHLKAIHGSGNMGQKPGHWNSAWAEWIADNPNASTKEIFQQLGRMMDDFDLGHLPIHPYGK